MGPYLGDYIEDDTLHFLWSSNNSNGASVTRTVNGTISVYKDNGVAQSVAGITDTEDFDALTGIHSCSMDLSADAFYAVGADYAVVLSAATIDGQTVNAVLAHFSIENRSALRPTVNGRELDVTATGEAGLDLDNTAGALGTAQFDAAFLTAALIAADAICAAELAADAVTEIQSGLATAAALATVQADTDDIQTRLPAALVGGRMDSSVGAMAASVITAAAIAVDAIGASELAADAVAEIADAIWDELIAGHLGAGSTGLELSDKADASALATVQADTDDIQTRLPAALVGGRMDASVGAMAAAVVTAAAIAADAIGASELAADAVAEIQSGLATSAALATVQADTDDIQTRIPAALVGGRMDSSVGAMVAGIITALVIATGAVDADALATDAGQEIADRILLRSLASGADGGRTVQEALRILRNRREIGR